MAKLKIEEGADNPTLREVSEKILLSGKKDFKKFKKLFEDMRETMDDSKGVGLAAPQVGINVRAIVCLFNQGSSNELYVDMINPVIISRSDEMEVGEEGCLSLPGKFAKVARHASVTVKYIDMKGGENTLQLKGLNSVIVQHEIDHLDGKLFIDRVEEQAIKGQHIL